MMPHPVLAPQSQPPDAQLSPRAEAGGRGTGVDQGTQTRRGDMLRSPEAAAQDSADTIVEGSAVPYRYRRVLSKPAMEV